MPYASVRALKQVEGAVWLQTVAMKKRMSYSHGKI
jgi:hypothetical protein